MHEEDDASSHLLSWWWGVGEGGYYYTSLVTPARTNPSLHVTTERCSFYHYDTLYAVVRDYALKLRFLEQKYYSSIRYFVCVKDDE